MYINYIPWPTLCLGVAGQYKIDKTDFMVCVCVCVFVCTSALFGFVLFKREEEHEVGSVGRWRRICVEMGRGKNMIKIFYMKICQNGEKD